MRRAVVAMGLVAVAVRCRLAHGGQLPSEDGSNDCVLLFLARLKWK